MNKLEYKKIKNYVNQILFLDTKNEFTFISELHIPKPGIDTINLEKYYSINFITYILTNIKNFLIFPFFIFLRLKNSGIQKNKFKESYDNIFVCHLNDQENLINLSSNNHFGNLLTFSDKKSNVLRIFIDHRKSKEFIQRKILNTLILNSKISLINSIKIIICLIKRFILLKKFLKKNKFNNKNFNFHILNSVFTRSSFLNYNLYLEAKYIFHKFNTKNIFYTFEGHAYERLINLASNQSLREIKTFAYPHGSLTKDQNSIFLKLNNKLMPNYILCPGRVSYDYFNFYKFTNLKIIGSNRFFDTKLKSQRSISEGVIVIPDGSFSETKMLYELTISLAKRFINHNFYFKFHPYFEDIDFFTKNRKPKNIYFIDNKKFNIYDSSCSIVVYRGSAAILDFILAGFIPKYYSIPSFPSKNILFKFEKNLKFNINNFLKRYDSDIFLEIQKFSRNYYTKQIEKNLIY